MKFGFKFLPNGMLVRVDKFRHHYTKHGWSKYVHIVKWWPWNWFMLLAAFYVAILQQGAKGLPE